MTGPQFAHQMAAEMGLVAVSITVNPSTKGNTLRFYMHTKGSLPVTGKNGPGNVPIAHVEAHDKANGWWSVTMIGHLLDPVIAQNYANRVQDRPPTS